MQNFAKKFDVNVDINIPNYFKVASEILLNEKNIAPGLLDKIL